MIFLAAALAFAVMGSVPFVLQIYVNEPVVFTLSSLMLVSSSMHMGILPMYLWFMLVTPLVLVTFQKGHAALIFVVCASVWMFGQTGLIDLVTQWGEASYADRGRIMDFGIFFNVFGWQVLFFGGLYIGFRIAKDDLDMSFLHQPVYRFAFFVGVVMFVFLGLLDRIVFDYWVSDEFSATFLDHISRQNLSILYVFAFALDLYLVVWLLVAGPSCGIRWISWSAGVVNWIFTRRFLVFLGQHSLHVFSFHILLVYILEIAIAGRDTSELTGAVILCLGVASLYLPAWWHAKHVAKQKALRASKAAS